MDSPQAAIIQKTTAFLGQIEHRKFKLPNGLAVRPFHNQNGPDKGGVDDTERAAPIGPNGVAFIGGSRRFGKVETPDQVDGQNNGQDAAYPEQTDEIVSALAV